MSNRPSASQPESEEHAAAQEGRSSQDAPGASSDKERPPTLDPGTWEARHARRAEARGVAEGGAGQSGEGSGTVPQVARTGTSSDDDQVVQVRALGKRYGKQWAMRDLDFNVRRGEIFGIIGPNGAGKTTTIKVLSGLLAPTAGTAMVGDIRVDDPRHKSRIGYLPEESPLYEDMTPVAYLRFFAELYKVPRKAAEARIEKALTDLKLDVRDEKKIGDMSKGMKRKVAIARSLVNDPDLLIYDEPASGLDPVVSAYILEMIQHLRNEGKTVLFSAHNLYHVERICDRVMILRKGEVVAMGTMPEIRAKIGGTEYVVTTDVELDGTKPGARGFELTVKDFSDVHTVEKRAKAEGGRIVDVREKELSLEEIFLREAAD